MSVDPHQLEPFARSRLPPAALTVEGRIGLLREAATDLIDGKLPRPEVRAFLAAGLANWLAEGGELVDWWGLRPGRGRALIRAAAERVKFGQVDAVDDDDASSAS